MGYTAYKKHLTFSVCSIFNLIRKRQAPQKLLKKFLMENFIFCAMKVSLNLKCIYGKVELQLENSLAGSLRGP